MTGSHVPIHQHTINLQATLSAASAAPNTDRPEPHHPIECPECLYLYEDGRFACIHVEVPPDDVRTGYSIDHSIALLLIECARELL